MKRSGRKRNFTALVQNSGDLYLATLKSGWNSLCKKTNLNNNNHCIYKFSILCKKVLPS